MSSPKALPVLQDQLALPVRGVSAQVIRQAIASQSGDVVYEILSRTQQGDTLFVTYRALPRGLWTQLGAQLGTLPRHRWPLVPQEEKDRRLRFWAARAEVLLLGLLAVCFALMAFWQLLQVVELRRYRQALVAHTSALSTALPARAPLPQQAWVTTLNNLTRQLTPLGVSLVSFDFAPTRAQVQLSASSASVNAVRQALLAATGQEPVQTAPNVWQW